MGLISEGAAEGPGQGLDLEPEEPAEEVKRSCGKLQDEQQIPSQ